MVKLIVVIGLPGSGKTHYLQELKARKLISGYYDDYQKNAYGKVHEPHFSRHYGPLLSKLKKGQTTAISDIIYCNDKDLDALLLSILNVLPETEIELHYFENDPINANINIKKRGRADYAKLELAYVEEHSPTYVIPKIKKLPVYRKAP